MPSTIDPDKLSALHEYLIAGGSPEEADVAKQLGVKKGDKDSVDSYVAELKKLHPDIYGSPDEEPVVEQEPPAVVVPPVEKVKTPAGKIVPVFSVEGISFVILDQNNSPTALEVVKATDSKVILKVAESREPVSIMLRGKVTELDLVQIRKLSADAVVAPHGVTASQLLSLAELAKA